MSDTTIATLETIIGADSSNFDKATDGVRSRLEGLAKVAGGVVSIVAGVFAAGAIITATGNYDEAIKNIQSVTGATAVQTSALSSELLKVGSGAVAGPQAVANAYYDIAGGVADASVRMATLNAAIATSEAGNADLGATTQGLISVMNAYQMSASEAGFASDVFTRTVGMGVGSMDAFVAAISPMSGLAAKSGIGFDELGSMLAYMTTQGSSASQSATQLKGVITAFLSPNKSMAAALRKRGWNPDRRLLRI